MPYYTGGKHTKNKRILTKRAMLSLAAAATLTGALIVNGITDSIVTKQIDYSQENTIGYYDIAEYSNSTVHQNNFVMLKVNSDIKDITSLRSKIEKCIKNNISIGLILDTKASDLGTIYKDIDFLSAILNEYHIDLPIYLNINSIMNNHSLNNEEKQALIKAFQERADLSRICYGYYGTDTSLVNCNLYVCDTTNKDCFLIQESKTINYQGQHTITSNLDGEITSTSNLARYVEDNGYNNTMILPTYYIAKENDTYQSIAMRFGLSTEDLKDYNDNQKIKVGTYIKVPNLYQSIDLNNGTSFNYAIARGTNLTGDEISVDWSKLSTSSRYIMIRGAYDPDDYETTTGIPNQKLSEYIFYAKENNLPFGLYYEVEHDMKISIYRSRLDSYLTALENKLKNMNIDYNPNEIPLFIKFNNYFDNNNYYELLRAAKEVGEKHGFTNIGLYSNETLLETIISDLHDLSGNKKDIDELELFIWSTGKNQNNTEMNYNPAISIAEVKEPINTETPLYQASIIDASNRVTDSGAQNNEGESIITYLYNTDVFKDQLDKEYVSNEDLGTIRVDLTKYTNIPIKKAIRIALIGIMTLFDVFGTIIIGGYLYVLVQRKKKQEELREERMRNQQQKPKTLQLTDGRKNFYDQYK